MPYHIASRQTVNRFYQSESRRSKLAKRKRPRMCLPATVGEPNHSILMSLRMVSGNKTLFAFWNAPKSAHKPLMQMLKLLCNSAYDIQQWLDSEWPLKATLQTVRPANTSQHRVAVWIRISNLQWQDFIVYPLSTPFNWYNQMVKRFDFKWNGIADGRFWTHGDILWIDFWLENIWSPQSRLQSHPSV